VIPGLRDPQELTDRMAHPEQMVLKAHRESKVLLELMDKMVRTARTVILDPTGRTVPVATIA